MSGAALINDGGITSNEDLDKWGYKNIPGYIGCIVKKQMNSMKFVPGSSWIINMDDNKGTHWVAMRVSNKRKAVLYVDSFGFPPEDITVRAVWKHKYPIYYSEIDRQLLHGDDCGQEALDSLYKMAHAPNDWRVFKKLGG
jgi:hypothetical protein